MTCTKTIARTIAELSNLTGKSFIILEADHFSSSNNRVRSEFISLGEDTVEAILETNVALVEFVSSMEATGTFLEFEADFPTNTPTDLVATLVRPRTAPISFTQGSGFGRTTNGFRSNALVDA